MTNAPKIQDIYDEYVKAQNEANRKDRYKGKEEYYHASGAGSCSRKLYFESVAIAKPTNSPKPDSLRKMRLGTIFHNEMEDCFTTHGTGTGTGTGTNSTGTEVYQEKEILLGSLRVRGYYDLVLKTEDNRVYLYDYKTMGSYPWKLKFGRSEWKPKPNLRYEYQLGTYGYAIQKEFGRLDGMFLVYYNKDTSVMKQIEVNLNFIDRAYNFWANINSEHKKGMPMLLHGISPAQSWECNYCQFKDLCSRTK